MTPHHTPSSGGQLSATSVDPIFVSVKEAARLLSLTPWQIYQMCTEGRLESGKEGRRRLVSYAAVKAYAAELIGSDDDEAAS